MRPHRACGGVAAYATPWELLARGPQKLGRVSPPGTRHRLVAAGRAGKRCFANGDVYEGDFRQGKIEGRGALPPYLLTPSFSSTRFLPAHLFDGDAEPPLQPVGWG